MKCTTTAPQPWRLEKRQRHFFSLHATHRGEDSQRQRAAVISHYVVFTCLPSPWFEAKSERKAILVPVVIHTHKKKKFPLGFQPLALPLLITVPIIERKNELQTIQCGVELQVPVAVAGAVAATNPLSHDPLQLTV